jgi:hypothetical protein
MEEKSGILFNKARVALARKWIGKVDESWVQDKGWPRHILLLWAMFDTPASRNGLYHTDQGWPDRRR